MKLLVTGADGFVGRRLVRRLAREGHAVTAATGPGTAPLPDLPSLAMDVTRDPDVRAALETGPEVVFHLAALASGAEARTDPGRAWDVNATGTARVAEAAAARGCRLVLVSTAEVYGAQGGRLDETCPAEPCSPYAASKLAGEIAAQAVRRRVGLGLVVVRPFPHTGGGQDARFVAPAFAARIRAAVAAGQDTVPVGNLDPVRDFLHVDDVVDAYVRLLDVPADGTVYNVASGVPVSVRALFEGLVRLAGARVRPVVEAALVRPADIPSLVGDAGRLIAATGWSARRTLDEALREVLDAETD